MEWNTHPPNALSLRPHNPIPSQDLNSEETFILQLNTKDVLHNVPYITMGILMTTSQPCYFQTGRLHLPQVHQPSRNKLNALLLC